MHAKKTVQRPTSQWVARRVIGLVQAHADASQPKAAA